MIRVVIVRNVCIVCDKIRAKRTVHNATDTRARYGREVGAYEFK